MRYEIDSLMHEDEKFLALSDAGQALWTLLLTGPQRRRIPGLQHVTLTLLAETRRRTRAQVEEALDELLKAEMVRYDPKARVLLLPNQPYFNDRPNGNMIRGWFTEWKGIPDSPLKEEFVRILQNALDFTPGKGSADRIQGWSETFATLTTKTKKGRVTPSDGGGKGSAENGPVDKTGEGLPEKVAILPEGLPSQRDPQPRLRVVPSTPAQAIGIPSVSASASPSSSLSPSPTTTTGMVPKGLGEQTGSGSLYGSDLRSESDPDPERGDARGERPAKIRCPSDLWDRFPTDTKATLSTFPIPEWAQRASCLGFAARYAGRADDLRLFDAWVASAVRAIQADWNDPSKRPKEPEPETPPKARRKWKRFE